MHPSFTVDSRRKSEATLRRIHGSEAALVDVTSRSTEPWVRFSPFFPHGQIPVPNSPGWVSQSVEGIWQGLKCFERADIDVSKFENRNMRGIKRSSLQFGAIRGHRFGVDGELLSYVDARKSIYLPTYEFVLIHKLSEPLAELLRLAAKQPVVLLDYETNGDINDVRSPLSHAQLIVSFLKRLPP